MSSGHRSSSPITRCRTQRHRLFHPRSTPEWCDAWVDKAVDSGTLKCSIGWQTEHAQEVRQLAAHSSKFSGGKDKAMDPLALFISQRAIQTFCICLQDRQLDHCTVGRVLPRPRIQSASRDGVSTKHRFLREEAQFSSASVRWVTRALRSSALRKVRRCVTTLYPMNATTKVEMLQSRHVQLLPLTSILAKAMLSQDFQRDRAFKSVVVRRL